MLDSWMSLEGLLYAELSWGGLRDTSRLVVVEVVLLILHKLLARELSRDDR